jgi:hypothetical protein
VDADGADDVAGTADDDLHLRVVSPCINRGTNSPPSGLPAADFEGEARIANGTVDMGADEMAFVPDPCQDPFADADGDDDVDQDDFGAFQICRTGPDHVFPIATCSCFNRNGDDHVGQADLDQFEACASGPSVLAAPTCDD